MLGFLRVSQGFVPFKQGVFGDVKQAVEVEGGHILTSPIETRGEIPATFCLGQEVSKQLDAFALF